MLSKSSNKETNFWNGNLSFHQLKILVSDKNLSVPSIHSLLLDVSRKGIIRDVELLWPIVVANNLYHIMEQAFVICASECHLTILKYMMENLGDVPSIINAGFRASVKFGHCEIVDFFLKKGCDVHLDDDQLLAICCANGDYLNVLQLLVDYGIDVWKHYHKAYNYCLNNKHHQCAEFLVKYSNQNPPKKEKDKIESYENELQDEEETMNSDDKFDDYQSEDEIIEI